MRKVVPRDAVLIPDNAQCVFEGIIYDVYHWPQKLFDGSTGTFEMLKRADTVTALCIVEDKILVLNDEQPNRGSRLTFPGGRVDGDDGDIVAAAQREVLEETGYSFRNWKLVQVAQPFTKVEWFVYQFIAWEVSGTEEPHVDPGERISVQKMSFEQIRKLILDRTDHMGEWIDLIKPANSERDLMDLPEFTGKTVDR